VWAKYEGSTPWLLPRFLARSCRTTGGCILMTQSQGLESVCQLLRVAFLHGVGHHRRL